MDCKLTKKIEFSDLNASTMTFIIVTNISVNIEKLFEKLPITEYKVLPKKRGKKKKTEEVVLNPNKDVKEGSIITLDLANRIRGVILKPKKKTSKRNNYFRNSVTVVMIIDGKAINFKISNNGTIQMTGCKTEIQAEKCIQYLWGYIEEDTELYTFTEKVEKSVEKKVEKKVEKSVEKKSVEKSIKKDSDSKISPKKKRFTAIIAPVMRNIDFSLGFQVDRADMNNFFNKETEYSSLLETSIGYTGVNIKFPLKDWMDNFFLKELVWENKKWKINLRPYVDFLNTFKEKERQKKLLKPRYITFLVFQSGRVIMSAMCAELSEPYFYRFMEIVDENYKKFIQVIKE